MRRPCGSTRVRPTGRAAHRPRPSTEGWPRPLRLRSARTRQGAGAGIRRPTLTSHFRRGAAGGTLEEEGAGEAGTPSRSEHPRPSHWHFRPSYPSPRWEGAGEGSTWGAAAGGGWSSPNPRRSSSPSCSRARGEAGEGAGVGSMEGAGGARCRSPALRSGCPGEEGEEAGEASRCPIRRSPCRSPWAAGVAEAEGVRCRCRSRSLEGSGRGRPWCSSRCSSLNRGSSPGTPRSPRRRTPRRPLRPTRRGRRPSASTRSRSERLSGLSCGRLRR